MAVQPWARGGINPHSLMPISRFFRRFLLVLSLASAVALLAAPEKTTAELTADLRKAINRPGIPTDPRLSAFCDQADQLSRAGRYAELEHYTNQLRQLVSGFSEEIREAFEQLAGNIQAESAQVTIRAEAGYDDAVKEFLTRFDRKAVAADYDALLRQLAAQPSLPVGAYGTTAPVTQKIEQLRTFITRWQDYLLQTERGNLEQAAQALTELTQLAARLPIIPRSQLATMQNELTNRVSGRGAEGDPRLDALQKQLATTIDSAKSAADFDAILLELARQPANRQGSRSNQWESFRRYVTRWQDYFGQVGAGRSTEALNTLRDLSSQSGFEAVYPRSRIMERIYAQGTPAAAPAQPPPTRSPAPTAAPVDPAKLEPVITPAELTFENLPQFYEQVMQNRVPGDIHQKSDLSTEIMTVRAAEAQLRAGSPGAVIQSLRSSATPGRNGHYAEAIYRVKTNLVARAAAMHWQAPPEIQPLAKEGYENYHRRLYEHAVLKKNWPLVNRILSGVPGVNNNTAIEYSAFRAYFRGTQQEAAGLWMKAVQSYFAAFEAGSPDLPVDEIAERLKRIKAEHPEEYLQAERGERMVVETVVSPGARSPAQPARP